MIRSTAHHPSRRPRSSEPNAAAAASAAIARAPRPAPAQNVVRLPVAIGARRHQPPGGLFPEPLHQPEAEAKRVPAFSGRRLQDAVPRARIDVHRPNLHPVRPRIAHDLGGGVEAHRLAVEQRAGEYVRITALEPGRGVHQDGEARRMALGEAVLPEPFDLPPALLGELRRAAPGRQPFEEAAAKPGQGADSPKSRHRPAQAVRFRRREPRSDDGDPHRLLLEDGHPQGLAQDRLELRQRIADLLPAVAPAKIRVNHPSLDRTRPHDRHLDHQIVEGAGLHAGEEAHLGAALHLEHPQRIGPTQHVVDGRILRGHAGEIEPAAVVGGQQVETPAKATQHPEPEHVHLEDPQRFEIVLVPLDHGAAGHGGGARSEPPRRAAPAR